MLNEILIRTKKVQEETNKITNIICKLFFVITGIILFLSLLCIIIIGEIKEDKETLICLLIFFIGTGAKIAFDIIELKAFKEKLELKLTDGEKVDKINKALEEAKGRIVFTEDYIIIFNKEIFETSEIERIKPIFEKGRRMSFIILEFYLKNENKYRRLQIGIANSFGEDKKEIRKLMADFEKMREANILVEELTLKGFPSNYKI